MNINIKKILLMKKESHDVIIVNVNNVTNRVNKPKKTCLLYMRLRIIKEIANIVSLLYKFIVD